MWQSLVDAAKLEYNSIRIWPRRAPPIAIFLGRSPAPRSVWDNQGPRDQSRLTSPCLGIYYIHNLRISRRTALDEGDITLYGWPSRGGVIVLEHATPPDFDFLHLDALDPPLRRNADQDAEDAFCQGLLHLGAIWWDSEARRKFVKKLEHGDGEAFEAVEANENLEPTRRECGWVRVAWPSHPPGALCVLACAKVIMGRSGDEKPRPRHHGIISLARTMDERCTVLQRLGGTMYASISEYQGPTFLRAWEEDHQGESGPLYVEEFFNPLLYGGHPDEALGLAGAPRSST